MPRDRREDEGASGGEAADARWWGKQLGRDPEMSDALREAEEAAAEDERERAEAIAELTWQLAEVTNRLAEAESQLAALHAQDAREKLDRSVEARDRAVREAASALERINVALQQVEEQRGAVVRAEQELHGIAPEVPVTIGPEPALPDAALDALIPLVRARLDERLEIDLVEAAAASHRLTAIDELPQHLRELARQLRSERLREALASQDAERAR